MIFQGRFWRKWICAALEEEVALHCAALEVQIALHSVGASVWKHCFPESTLPSTESETDITGVESTTTSETL